MSREMGDLQPVLASASVLGLSAAAGAQQHRRTQPFPAAPVAIRQPSPARVRRQSGCAWQMLLS